MTLQAGAELDRLIAEKVMGWKLAASAKAMAGFEDGYGDYILGFQNGPERLGMTSYPEAFTESFQPSINISHAWEVVERLRAIGCPDIYIATWHEGGFAAFVERADAHDTGDIIATTAPLAICRAALLAVE